MTDDYMTQIAYASNYYENAPEAIYIPSQDQSVIKKNLLDIIKEIITPYTVEVAEAQETQEKLIKNLSLYTNSTEEAIKELDFVRTQVDHLAMEYSQIAAAYADLYKVSLFTEYSEHELHDLFKAIMRAAYHEKLSEEDISDILAHTGELLKNKNFSSNEFNKAIGYKLKIANTWSKATFKSEDDLENHDSADYMDLFANFIFDNLPDVSSEDFNSAYVKANYYENRMYDKNIQQDKYRENVKTVYPFMSKIKNIKIPSSLMRISNLLPWVATALTVAPLIFDWLSTNQSIKQHYQNSNYMESYQDYNKTIKIEHNQKLKGYIEKTINLNGEEFDINPIKSNDVIDILELELEKSNTDGLSNNPIININTPYPGDFRDSVKQIIAETLDDFAQLKGFKKKTV